jgi:hypothetical protein
MNKILQFLLICLFYMQPTLADKTDILIIDPTFSNIDSIPKLSRNIKIHLGKFTDNTPSQATGIIGKTRTGIKSFAPIILKPPLVESLRKSFTSVLQQRENLSADASVATYVLDLTITDCTIIENSALFSQTLTAFLKMEVRLTNPLEADKVHSFTVESQTSTKSMDTSKYAVSTLRDAIISVFSEIIKTTNKY